LRDVRDLMVARVPVPGEKPADYQGRVRSAEARYSQESARLSQILLGPVANQLGTHRLAIVAEGILQYVPFAALPTPGSGQNQTPLISNHEIVNLPSASTLAVLRNENSFRKLPDRTIAVFADPVFEASDPRVARPRPALVRARIGSQPAPTVSGNSLPQLFRSSTVGGFNVPRLPFTRQEAETILSFVPEDGRLGVFDFNASRSTAMSPELARYRIVHFATHGILNDDQPELSGLVFSLVDKDGNPQKGLLRLRDIYSLKLSAELVVLSACDTALGKDVKGEGLIGMVRGFMYSGTPRVLASLWKVDDEATAELMKEFYKHLLQEGMTPAAALRQAQITQMQKKSRQSPYYWAGFQLQGEWN